MPRTPIPGRLIHRPEEVERNAERFDQLCRLAEEVAFPVVREALVRETAATGAEALTNEAKLALEALAEDAAALEGLDEQQILDEVQKSLSRAIPPPDEEEYQTLAREVAQVLTSTWLEMLRSDLSKVDLLLLSDRLLPEVPSSAVRRFIGRLRTVRPKLPQILTDTLASFAVNELDANTIMTTLRVKLFPEPRLVDLPFELVLAGAPGMPVLATTRPRYKRLLEEIAKVPDRTPIERRTPDPIPATSGCEVSGFATKAARIAVVDLCEPLSPDQYKYLARVASPSVARRGRQVLTSRRS